MIFDLALNEIDNGLRGENQGLSIGLPRFQEYVPGVQPGNIYIIGGETGSGKSLFAVNNFIYTPYEDYIENFKDKFDLKIFIWSCEMSKSALGIRAISRKMYLDHNIVIDTNYVLSRGKNKISDDIYNKVRALKGEFEEMSDYIEIYANENPTGIRNTILKYVNNTGEAFYKDVDTHDGNKKVFNYYKPRKKQLIVALIDHVSIVKRERGFSKKENIDKLMDYEIDMRDMFGVSFINVQQLNRTMSSSDRFKIGRVEPQLSDYKESSDTTDAANYVISIFSPQRYEISPYRSYLINKKDGGIADRFRSLGILKNREGAADMQMGALFLGESGIIKELPRAENMERKTYDAINNIKKIV